MYIKYIKRFLDVVFAITLLVISIPVMIITGIILNFSMGKCRYKEEFLREGLHNKSYTMYKFLTKIKNNDEAPLEKRYTKASRMIDVLKLNELPQLINIIKGEMSFVGPRPFIVGEKLHPGKISEKRYLVRPGVTGLAQVKYGQSLTHKQKLLCDEIYYDNLSFWLDLKIVLNTPYFVLKNYINYIRNYVRS